MKQGRASISGKHDQKVEPVPYAKSPGGVGNIGVSTGNHIMGDGVVRADGGRTPVDMGRGYRAPGIESKTHKGGSQGSY